MATQLKGELMPIRQLKKKDKPKAITPREKRFGAFSVLKQVLSFLLYVFLILYFAHWKTDFATEVLVCAKDSVIGVLHYAQKLHFLFDVIHTGNMISRNFATF